MNRNTPSNAGLKWAAFALMFAAGVALARDWTVVSVGAGSGTLWSVDIKSLGSVVLDGERLLVATVQRTTLDQRTTELQASLPEAHCNAPRGQLTLGDASAIYTTGEETNVGSIAAAICKAHLSRQPRRK